jgi:Galactose oxidase-like, Early set domain/Bacterial Ig-like domain (group 1)
MTRLRQLTFVTIGILLAAGSLRCSGDTTQPPTAAAIESAGGDGQSGPVGGTLASPLVVLVTDPSGNPVQGVSVSWDPQGAGSVSATTAQTGVDGRASVQRTLGATPGEQTTTASVSGLSGSPVTFVATATDGTTPILAMKTQPSSAAQSGLAFAVQPVIQLKDASGNDKPQSGVAVTAAIASGTGTLGGTLTQATDGTGAATFTDLKITGDVGSSYTLRFTAPGTAQALSAAITLGAGAASIAITTNPPTSALTSEVFDPSVQPVVQVKDGNGNPAAGAQVTASIGSGGGLLEGNTNAVSDAGGVAKFGDLGIKGTGANTLAFTTGSASVTSSPVNVSALPAAATTGSWGPVVAWPMVPLHMHLLPTGKILAWGKYDTGANGTMGGRPRLWDPAAGPPTTARMIDVDTMLFCSGHAFMADGKLMVSGGHKLDDKGIDVTNIFDPASETFATGLPKMAFGRWYPTVTELGDGRMLTMAGRDSAGNVVTTPEIWENNQWVKLPGAGLLEIPYYPRNFVDPKNGRIFMAGERIQSRWFDVDGSAASGRGKWISGPSHIWPFNRDYGTAVMYEPGKILYAGGGGNTGWPTKDPRSSTPTATAEMIDLNAAPPTWTSAGSMSVARRHLNSTILPDGQVLITGGTSGGGFVDINPGDATRTAELWNPAHPTQWTTLAANSIMRVYHSVSMLLPDGTVLHGASGNAMAGTAVVPDEANHEIFSPPYLFKGARPAITTAPASVTYGQKFSVATPNAAQITAVRWIRIGSVTHAFDFGQRANTLSFTRTSSGVDVTAPGNPNLAPPGHYLVFILNRNGVPSVGKIVRLQ